MEDVEDLAEGRHIRLLKQEMHSLLEERTCSVGHLVHIRALQGSYIVDTIHLGQMYHIQRIDVHSRDARSLDSHILADTTSFIALKSFLQSLISASAEKGDQRLLQRDVDALAIRVRTQYAGGSKFRGKDLPQVQSRLCGLMIDSAIMEWRCCTWL